MRVTPSPHPASRSCCQLPTQALLVHSSTIINNWLAYSNLLRATASALPLHRYLWRKTRHADHDENTITPAAGRDAACQRPGRSISSLSAKTTGNARALRMVSHIGMVWPTMACSKANKRQAYRRGAAKTGGTAGHRRQKAAIYHYLEIADEKA